MNKGKNINTNLLIERKWFFSENFMYICEFSDKSYISSCYTYCAPNIDFNATIRIKFFLLHRHLILRKLWNFSLKWSFYDDVKKHHDHQYCKTCLSVDAHVFYFQRNLSKLFIIFQYFSAGYRNMCNINCTCLFSVRKFTDLMRKYYYNQISTSNSI